MSRRGQPKVVHGEALSLTKEYRTWKGIKQRCKPGSKDSARYHDRGIYVCDRWRDDYQAFLADMGRAPGPEYQIERADNDGPYAPGNCCWATRKEQGNNKRNNRHYYIAGERHNIREAAAALKCNTATIWEHLKRGKTWRWVVAHFEARKRNAA